MAVSLVAVTHQPAPITFEYFKGALPHVEANAEGGDERPWLAADVFITIKNPTPLIVCKTNMLVI